MTSLSDPFGSEEDHARLNTYGSGLDQFAKETTDGDSRTRKTWYGVSKNLDSSSRATESLNELMGATAHDPKKFLAMCDNLSISEHTDSERLQSRLREAVSRKTLRVSSHVSCGSRSLLDAKQSKHDQDQLVKVNDFSCESKTEASSAKYITPTYFSPSRRGHLETLRAIRSAEKIQNGMPPPAPRRASIGADPRTARVASIQRSGSFQQGLDTKRSLHRRPRRADSLGCSSHHSYCSGISSLGMDSLGSHDSFLSASRSISRGNSKDSEIIPSFDSLLYGLPRAESADNVPRRPSRTHSLDAIPRRPTRYRSPSPER